MKQTTELVGVAITGVVDVDGDGEEPEDEEEEVEVDEDVLEVVEEVEDVVGVGGLVELVEVDEVVVEAGLPVDHWSHQRLNIKRIQGGGGNYLW